MQITTSDTQRQVIYDACSSAKMSYLGREKLHLVEVITRDLAWPRTWGEHDEDAVDFKKWGAASKFLQRLTKVVLLPVEMGVSKKAADELGLPQELVDISDEEPILSTKMRPLLTAMLADEADVEEVRALLIRTQELNNRAKERATAVGGITAADLRAALLMSVTGVQIADEDGDLARFCDEIMTYVEEADRGSDVEDAEDLAGILAEAQELAIDLLSYRPRGGYSEAYARVMAQSEWINPKTPGEALLMLNDAEARNEARNLWREQNPIDQWGDKAPDDFWPSPRPGQETMRLMDSSHHYGLEDYKESGRTSRGTQRMLLELIAQPAPKTISGRLRTLLQEHHL